MIAHSIVDTRSVEFILRGLSATLSPQSLGSFVGGPATENIQKRARNRFDREGDDVSGGRWKPLAPFTEQIREEQGFGPTGPINRRTGELEAYITGSTTSVTLTGGDGAVGVYPGRPASGELSLKMRRAQSGRPAPGEIARPVLGLNSTDLMQTMMLLQTWIVGAMEMGARR